MEGENGKGKGENESEEGRLLKAGETWHLDEQTKNLKDKQEKEREGERKNRGV
jgi:hypothetical protein